MFFLCEWISKLYRMGIEWILIRLFFSKVILFILGLVFSHGLVENSVMAILVSYFSYNWTNYDMLKAAAIVNGLNGISSMLVIVIAHISDACFSHFQMILATVGVYVTGLALLWLSSSIFYSSVEVYGAALLIALGIAGRYPLLWKFLGNQLREVEQNQSIDVQLDADLRSETRADLRLDVQLREVEQNQSIDVQLDADLRSEARADFWWTVARFISSIVAIFASSNASWSNTFMISAMVMGVSGLIFWSGICFYYNTELTEIPTTILLRVVKAAVSKRNLNYPLTPTRFFQNDRNEVQLSPQFFRCLDKAAIIESNAPSLEEEGNRDEICTVSQVKEVKLLLTMFPMWTTFLVYCLVDAVGRTFFYDQSTNMNDQIGSHFKVSLTSFYAMSSFTGFIISSLYDLVIPERWRDARHQLATLTRIGVGMLCSVLCCICAWRVEVRRLHLIKKYDALDDVDIIIPMSIFWLAPQFTLLGLMKGLAVEGLDELFYHQVARTMRRYKVPFNTFVLGIGQLLNIPFMFACHSWIKDTINVSHLDKYYLTLGALSSANLLLYVYISIRYANQRTLRKEIELVNISGGTTDLEIRPATEGMNQEEIRSVTKDMNQKEIGSASEYMNQEEIRPSIEDMNQEEIRPTIEDINKEEIARNVN